MRGRMAQVAIYAGTHHPLQRNMELKRKAAVERRGSASQRCPPCKGAGASWLALWAIPVFAARQHEHCTSGYPWVSVRPSLLRRVCS